MEALPRSVAPYEPPPSLKASLMEQVRAEAPEPQPARERRRLSLSLPRLRPAMAWAAAAILVAGVLLGYGVSQLGGDDDETRTLQAQVDMSQLPDGTASLSVPDDEGRGSVLRVEGLPDAGKERVYQVWIERDGQVVPVSIFDVDEQRERRGRCAGGARRRQRGDGHARAEGRVYDANRSPVLRVDV